MMIVLPIIGKNMNNHIHLLVCLGLIMLCTSCKQSHDYFEFDKSIYLEREKGCNEYGYMQCCHYQGQEVLIANPKHSTALYIHKIDGGKYIQKLHLPSYQSIRGFYYDSDSSIYYCPNYSTEVLRYNIFSQKLDTIVNMTLDLVVQYIQEGINVGCGVEFMCGMSTPLWANDSQIIVGNVVHQDCAKDAQIPLYVFMLENNKTPRLITNIGKFPQSYFEKGKTIAPFNGCAMYCINDEGQIIVSHTADHNLYVFQNSVLTKTIECKSRCIERLPPLIKDKDVINSELMEKREFEFPFYSGIFYDNYRKNYYRLTTHLHRDSQKQDECSIMILDEELKILGEQLFKDIGVAPIVCTDGVLLVRPDDYSGKTKLDLYRIKKQ